jgi:transcription antitermination protein NusB
MKSRRQSRVMAMQLLYAMAQQKAPLSIVLDGVMSTIEISDQQKEYGMKLVDLVQEHSSPIHSEIEAVLENWSWERVALIDGIILKIAWSELKFCGETPPKVSITEAIAISKKYSTEDSPKFINGVLDRLATDILTNSSKDK